MSPRRFELQSAELPPASHCLTHRLSCKTNPLTRPSPHLSFSFLLHPPLTPPLSYAVTSPVSSLSPNCFYTSVLFTKHYLLFLSITFIIIFLYHYCLILFTFPSSLTSLPLLVNTFLLFVLCFSFSVPHSSSLLSVSLLPTSSALRSCSTGDSLLSSAFIRSAKSAPALAPPLPVLLHHHHPLLPPLADQLAGTHSLHYLSACLSAWKLFINAD